MGPTWGPPGSCRPQMGPINLAIRGYAITFYHQQRNIQSSMQRTSDVINKSVSWCHDYKNVNYNATKPSRTHRVYIKCGNCILRRDGSVAVDTATRHHNDVTWAMASQITSNWDIYSNHQQLDCLFSCFLANIKNQDSAIRKLFKEVSPIAGGFTS